MDWPALKALALSLDLPRVEEATSWGQPCLKAHGKLWCWWSAKEDAPVFKMPSQEERDVLLEAEPDRFFTTDHYRPHALILMRPDQFDAEWACHNLLQSWRTMAPKRFLKTYDAEAGS